MVVTFLTSNPNVIYKHHMCLHKEERKKGAFHGKINYKIREPREQQRANT